MAVSNVVLDASFLVALATEHALTPAAEKIWRQGVDEGAVFHAPEFAYIEVGNAIATTRRVGKFTDFHALELMRAVEALPITIHSTKRHAHRALEVALRHRLSVYDACYVVVALEISGVLITADLKLHRRAKEVGLPVEALDEHFTLNR